MKKHIIGLSIIIFLASFLLCYISGAAQDSRPTNAVESKTIVAGTVGKKIDEYLNRSVPFGFSGVILVAQNDKIVLLSAYGLADRERRIPVTVDTVFYIGSITKQFTAAAILKLEMQGKLRVTDTLDKIFKDVPVDKKGITLHQLLTQSSGLGDTEDKYESPVQKDIQLRRIMEAKLEFDPGKEYSYSNAGYSLLGMIVEQVSGQPYEKYLHENLFKPAGMFQTGYRIPKWSKDKVAHGFSEGADKGSPLDRPWLEDGPSFALRGAGGMLSTLGDLYRWHLVLEKDEILSADAKRKIFGPHVKMDSNTFYGYGWSVQKTPRGTSLIEHNGSDDIFFADFRRYVDDNVVVIGLTNDIYGADVIEKKVPDIVFGSNEIKLPPITNPKEIPTAVLEKYAGTYQLPSGAVVNVSLKNRRLILDPVGQEAVNLLTNIEPSNMESFAELTRKGKDILNEALKGEFGLLKAAIAPEKFEPYKLFLSELFKTSESGNASRLKYEVLGSHPLWFSRDKPPTTFVRLIEDKGPSGLLLITWEKNRIRGRALTRESDNLTLRTPLVANSEKSFAGFHPGLEKPLNISFKTDRAGLPVAIEFKTDHRISTAKRVGDAIAKVRTGQVIDPSLQL